MRKAGLLAFAALCGAALTARAAMAQGNGDEEPPSTPPATTASAPAAPVAVPAQPPAAEDPQWRYDYGVARERLLAGDFGDAAERFAALVDRARDPLDRALAVSQRDLAQSWADRKLALVKRNDLGETPITAKAAGERTTDEIAQLYGSSILYGIGSGLWISAHTQPQGAAGVILPMIGIAGAGVGTVALLDVGHPFHYGVPQSIVSGLYVGLEEGIVLGAWGASSHSTNWGPTTVADVIWTSSTLGALGGGVIGATAGTTPGRAAFVGSAALWSGIEGGLLTATFASGSDAGSDALLAMGLTLNAGVVGGLLAAGPVSPTIGRVRFLDIGGLGGGLLVGGLYMAAANQNIDGHAAAGATALGIAAGLTVAWIATSKMPEDRLDEKDAKKEAKKDALLGDLQPTLAPVQGGATLGIAGTL